MIVMKQQYERVTDCELSGTAGGSKTQICLRRLPNVSWRTALETFLVVITTASLIVAYRHPSLPQYAVQMSPGGSPYVDLPIIPVKFEASDQWLKSAMFHNETILIDKMERFVELSSDDRGIVIIENWKDLHLPPPREVNPVTVGGPDETKATYTIAYWHHMHCIATIAKLFHNARSGVGNMAEDDDHMVYCLEVLRMAVMCLADTTPEDGVNSWQNTHQCRDHQALRSWSQDHAAWNWTSILGSRVDFL